MKFIETEFGQIINTDKIIAIETKGDCIALYVDKNEYIMLLELPKWNIPKSRHLKRLIAAQISSNEGVLHYSRILAIVQSVANEAENE